MKIVTCPQWGARKPKEPITTVPRSDKILIHQTAGHATQTGVPEIESLRESINYARMIQASHMDTNGWIDSGHSFLVCRNGVVLQGRWLTVSAIQAGHMVQSAHCPGQNGQIGIEHEHLGTESLTKIQRTNSARLIAWISQRYGLSLALPLFPHNHFYNTACPGNIIKEIPELTKLANQFLSSNKGV